VRQREGGTLLDYIGRRTEIIVTDAPGSPLPNARITGTVTDFALDAPGLWRLLVRLDAPWGGAGERQVVLRPRYSTRRPKRWPWRTIVTVSSDDGHIGAIADLRLRTEQALPADSGSR
jgi:hypothetical protein